MFLQKNIFFYTLGLKKIKRYIALAYRRKLLQNDYQFFIRYLDFYDVFYFVDYNRNNKLS